MWPCGSALGRQRTYRDAIGAVRTGYSCMYRILAQTDLMTI